MSPRARATLSAFAHFVSFVVSSAVAAPHPSLPPSVIPECLGVNIHFTDPKPGEMEMLAAAGFKWVRMDFAWAATERAKGEYDFAAYDRLVTHLDKHKLRALFILDYGNPLYDDGLPPHTDESRAAFAAWAAAVVKHFAGKGYLWEMWNEPNIAQFWKPKPDVQQYIALAKTTATALKKAAPTEAFIGPATSTIDLPFLEACFQAGLLESWAGVSVHPYRQTAPETVEEELRSVRLLIRKYAPKDKAIGDIPVISGEWGYSSAWKDFDEKKQAKYATRQLLNNIANDVALSIWYDWCDDGRDPKEPEHHFGLVHHEYHEGRNPAYDPKPGYSAVKSLVEQLGGMRFNKRVHLSKENDDTHRLLFQRNADLLVASWSAATWGDNKPSSGTSPEYRLLTGRAVRDWKVLAEWERLPLELVVRAPVDLTITSLFRNPHPEKLGIDVDFTRYFSSGHDATEGGPRDDYDASHAYTLEPNQQATRTTAFPVLRSSGDRLNRVIGQLRLAGGYDYYRQMAPIVVTNVLRPSLLPAGEKELPLKVENPSGDPFSGTVHLTFLRSAQSADDSGFGYNCEARIEMKAGDEETVTFLKLPKFSARPTAIMLGIISDDDGAAAVGETFLRPFLPIRDFTAKHLRAPTDGDPKATSQAELIDALPTVGAPPAQDGAVKLSYRFNGGWKFAVIIPDNSSTPKNEGFLLPTQFGLWLHGDGKGCVTRIRFRDSSGQTFQSDGPKIDWIGWRYITFPLLPNKEKPLAYWGGANDGVIYYPIMWDAIFLLDNVSRQPVEGEIYLSAPTLIY